MEHGTAFNRLCSIIEKLRSPQGCPWDREQTPHTLRQDLIEETYECIEAIDEKNPEHIKEELGDLFLLAAMISYMHEQENIFTISQALDAVSDKLIRRHPHVFAQADAGISTEQVLQNWAQIKVEQEGKKPKDSILDEVSRALPPLDRAAKLQKKAAKKGFDWPCLTGVLEKLNEEFEEVGIALLEAINNDQDQQKKEKLEEELGDLLFSVVNVCRFLKVDPSVALNKANVKFEKRFKYVEQKAKKSGIEMNTANLEIMDRYWNEAKNCTQDAG